MTTISTARKKKDISILYLCEVQHKTSKFNGLTWRKDNKNWQARLAHKGKKYHAGVFDIEEDAAMSVNLLCDKYEIKRKNPTIDIELYDTQQVMHSLSIVYKKVK